MRAEALHPVAWLAWLAAAALPALLTRNPLYLILALLANWLTYAALNRRGEADGRSWGSFVRFGALLWLLTVPFTMLTSHYGRLVILSLPASWPIIGGPLTGESLLYGLSSGLALITLLLAFAAFNLAVDQARLLRLTPGFLYQAGVITAIAVAFVPQMIAAWQSIREAQEVRGHRVRTPRDLLPLIIPLLVTALERAMHLAESMEARGFGRPLAPATARRRALQQLGVLLGLAALAVSLAGVGFWPERRLLTGSILTGGLVSLGVSFWDQGRRVERSHYRRWYWSPAAVALAGIGAAAAVAWLLLWFGQGNNGLLYYPYPPYSPWPEFHPLAGLLSIVPSAGGLILAAAEQRFAAQGRREEGAAAGRALAPVTETPQPGGVLQTVKPGLEHRRGVWAAVLRLLSALLLTWRH